MSKQIVQEFDPFVSGQRLVILQPPKFLYELVNDPKTAENIRQASRRFIHDIILGKGY